MSGNRKVSPEEKLRAVYEYLEGKGSLKKLHKSMALVAHHLDNGFTNTKPLVKVHLLKQVITHHILLNLSKQLLKRIYLVKVLLRI